MKKVFTEIILTLITVLGIYSCGNETNQLSQKTDSIIVLPKTDTAKTIQHVIADTTPDTLINSFMCDYLGGTQYKDESADSTKYLNWIKETLISISKNKYNNSLFNSSGAGPNGAIWNPGNDLFIWITSNKDMSKELCYLEMNGRQDKKIKPQFYLPENKTGSICYFTIPGAIWEKRLRKINTSDLIPMFGKEKLKRIKEISPGPPDTGKIIEFTFVHYETTGIQNRMKNYFHCEFGE